MTHCYVPPRSMYTRRPNYWHCFIEPVKEALELVGVDVREDDDPDGSATLWFGDNEGREAMFLLDYSDFPSFAEPWKSYIKKAGKSITAILKMKYCLRNFADYQAAPCPVIPIGYILGPESNQMTEDRSWLVENADALYEKRAAGGHRDGFDLNGAFHAPRVSPVRDHFLRGWRQAGGPGYTEQQVTGKRLGFRDYMASVSSHRFAINVCGPQDTIDRKVVEFCAMGMPTLSSRGLEDLILPGNRRFEHGVNVWFVDSWEDAAYAAESLRDDDVAAISEGARELWDEVFHPRAMGANLRRIVEEYMS